MALTKDRLTKRRNSHDLADPVAAGTRIFAGAISCLNAAGYAVPGETAADLKPRGVSQVFVDNTGGADGDQVVEVLRGIHCLKNDGSINRTHIESDAWIVDDETVAADDGGGTRSKAGRICDVDSDGVWVDFD